MKNNKIAIIVLCIIIILLLVVIFFQQKSIHNYSSNESLTTVTGNNLSKVETEIEDADNNDEVLEKYTGILSVDSNEFYETINNNPIDKYYKERYNENLVPNKQMDVLYQWIGAYEKEYAYLNDYLLSKLDDDNTENAKELKKYVKRLDEFSDYPQLIEGITFSTENYALGQGSGHKYDAAYNRLINERTKVLMLVEIANLSFAGNYNWHFDNTD